MSQISLTEMQEILNMAPVGIVLINSMGRIEWHNETLEQLLGISGEQLAGKALGDLPKEIGSVLNSPPDTILLQQNDQQRWLHCHRQSYDDGRHAHFYLDITTEQRLRLERDRLEEDLQQLTTRDPVTGLPNRRALLQGLEPLISRSRRYGNPLSLIKLHVELLETNNSSGIRLQDEAWLKVGQLLKEQMRWADIIGRFDGSDFLLILPETPADATETLAKKICESIGEIRVGPDETGIKPYYSLTSWGKGDDANLMLQRLSDGIAATLAA
jgi:diguanylate cyclase (GGDEF)-like protein